jgi:multisubunit Na+/H+ antiporter MnhG subunit
MLIIILLFIAAFMFAYNKNTTAIGFILLAIMYYASIIYLFKNLNTQPGKEHILNLTQLSDSESLLTLIKKSDLIAFLKNRPILSWSLGLCLLSIFIMLAGAVTVSTQYVIKRAQKVKSTNLYLNKEVDIDLYDNAKNKNMEDSERYKKTQHYELSITEFVNEFLFAMILLFALVLSFLFISEPSFKMTNIRIVFIIILFGVSINLVNHASLMRKIINEPKKDPPEKTYETKNSVVQAWQDILTFFHEPSL